MMRYNIDKKVRKIKPVAFIFIASLIGAAILLVLFKIDNKQVAKTTRKPLADAVATHTPKVKETYEGKYLLNGTIFWGRGIERWSKGDISWPFAKLSTFSPEKYDAWVADLECPITDNLISFEKQVSDLVFNCDPKFLPEMAKFFNIINLANNHSDNQAYTGLLDTRARLSRASVQHYGSYDPGVAEDSCEIVSLPVHRAGNTPTRDTAVSIPVAFCAWHYFYRTPKPGEIEKLKEYSMYMPVFAFVHMGSEYQAKANDIQTSIARQIIDAGASFVIANNPHWVQDSEAYNGKLIVYSTGNFIFDQLDYETQRSASIEMNLQASGESLDQWMELSSQCTAFHDTCIESIKQKSLVPYQAKLTFGVVAGDLSGNHQTRKADNILQKAVETRLEWATTIKGLGQ